MRLFVQLDPNDISGQKPTVYKRPNVAILNPTLHRICRGPVESQGKENQARWPKATSGLMTISLLSELALVIIDVASQRGAWVVDVGVDDGASFEICKDVSGGGDVGAGV